MSTVLQVIDPAGTVTEVVLETMRSEVGALPGHSFVLNGAGASAPRVLRIDDDLTIEGLPDGQELVIADFFSACTPDDVCTALLSDFDGARNIAITPATQPLAALQEGSFLMFSATAVPATLPTPPENDNPIGWKPIAALGGGLLVLGAGLGGGGGGGGDDVAPGAPTINAMNTNNTRPTISGTSEADSAISMTIVINDTGERIIYNTRADENGNWSIDTATTTPAAGAMPAAGLPENGSTINAVATDPAGNVSAVTTSPIVIDLTPPDAPVIAASGELSGAGVSLMLNQAESADGTVLQGQAEAGSSVNLVLSGDSSFSSNYVVQADTAGNWSLGLPASALPITDGLLQVTATATDTAGNTGAASSIDILIDRTLSGVTSVIAGIIDNQAPGIGIVNNGYFTNDTTPSIEGIVSGPIAADENLQILRNGAVVGYAGTNSTNFAWVDNLTEDGTYAYSTQLVDAAGNTGPLSGAFTMTLVTTAPAQTIDLQVANQSGTVVIANGDDTDVNAVTLTLSLSDVLESDETLQLYRTDTAGSPTLVGSATTGNALNPANPEIFEFADIIPDGSTPEYQAQVIDQAGNLSPLSDAFTFTVLPDTP